MHKNKIFSLVYNIQTSFGYYFYSFFMMRLGQYWTYSRALWKDHIWPCVQGMTCRSSFQFLAGTPVSFTLQSLEWPWYQFKPLFKNYNRVFSPWLKRSERETDQSYLVLRLKMVENITVSPMHSLKAYSGITFYLDHLQQ